MVAAAAPADVGRRCSPSRSALLGLGWNLGLVGGTAMVTDARRWPAATGHPGRVDLVVALAGATGGLASGFVVAATSYAALSLAGGMLALALVPVVLRRARAA